MLDSLSVSLCLTTRFPFHALLICVSEPLCIAASLVARAGLVMGLCSNTTVTVRNQTNWIKPVAPNGHSVAVLEIPRRQLCSCSPAKLSFSAFR